MNWFLIILIFCYNYERIRSINNENNENNSNDKNNKEENNKIVINNKEKEEKEERFLSFPIYIQNKILLNNLNNSNNGNNNNNNYQRRYLTIEDYNSPHAPMYRGYGTHFIYVWVGTPSQRVSVIVDTGSHYTAFPCKNCNNCGKHTDKYFDPTISSTSQILKCGTQKCTFSQSYTEGSSWNAYKIRDVFWIGGERYDMLNDPLKWSINFTFGCQSSETGLFRTQMENGIMGISADSNTLPYVLYDKKLISTNLFSLCLLHNGGVMSIGSINHNLNLSPIQYATLTHKSGYFTVALETIYFKKPNDNGDFTLRDLGEPKTKFNSGKGIIVDSGTTDSYLPSSISSSFRKIFHELTGLTFSNTAIELTIEKLHQLPIFVFRLRASTTNSNNDNKFIDVEFPPQHYMEPVPNQKGRYTMRLYLTEGNGGVIGANMMMGHNVIFDQKNLQVGFAKSHCQIKGEKMYDEKTKPVKIKSRREIRRQLETVNSISETKKVTKNSINHLIQTAPLDECQLYPLGPCSALCQRGPVKILGKSKTISPILRQSVREYRQMISHPIYSHGEDYIGYYSEGFQIYAMNSTCVKQHFLDKFDSIINSETTKTSSSSSSLSLSKDYLEQFRTCYIACSNENKAISFINSSHKNPFCYNDNWSECNKDCVQTKVTRSLYTINNSSGTFHQCQQNKNLTYRKCWNHKCYFNKFYDCGYLLQLTLPFFDIRLWSNALKEELIFSISNALNIDYGRVYIPFPPQRNPDDNMQVVFHIRLPVIDKNEPNFDLSTANRENDDQNFRVHSSEPKCSDFPLLNQNEIKKHNYDKLKNQFLSNLYNIHHTSSGDWKWLRHDTIQFLLLTPKGGSGNTIEKILSQHTKKLEKKKDYIKVHSIENIKTETNPLLSFINLNNPQSIAGIICVLGVIAVTVGLYLKSFKFQQHLRSRLEKPRDKIDVAYRAVGFSR